MIQCRHSISTTVQLLNRRSCAKCHNSCVSVIHDVLNCQGSRKRLDCAPDSVTLVAPNHDL
eukprot:1179623-Prorocentrum_minimum.AAC.5